MVIPPRKKDPDHRVHLRPHTSLGKSERVRISGTELEGKNGTTKKETEKPSCEEKMPDFLKPLCKSGSENLSAEGKKLTELLAKHQGAFAKGPDDLGRTHLVQHERTCSGLLYKLPNFKNPSLQAF